MRGMLLLVMVAIFSGLMAMPAKADYCTETFHTILETTGRAPHDPPGTCTPFASVQLRYAGGYAEIILMQDPAHPMPMTRAAQWVDIINDVAANVGRALSSMSDMRLPGVVHVIFVPQTGPDDARMRTVGQTYMRPGRQRDCPMIVYGSGERLTPGRARRTFAHELFHCAQYETFYNKTGDSASLWWREGSAEWFEDLAFPSLVADSDLAAAIRLYHARRRERGLHEMIYAPAVFFAWLERPAAVARYLSAMADTGGSQTEAMERALPAERYSEFAQAYLDDRIVFPSGTRVISPEAPAAATTTTGDPERDPEIRKSSGPKAFTVQEQKVEFVPGEYSPDGKAGTQERVFSERPGAWGKLPARLVVRCGERKRFNVAWMPVRNEPPPLVVKPGTTKATQCGECGATGGGVRRAGCVVGTWRMVSDTGNCSVLGSLMAGTGASVTVDECRPGEASATFNPDGTFGGMLTNAKRRATMRFPAGRGGREAPRMTVENIISLAKTSGLWKVTEETSKLELCNTSTVGTGTLTMSGVGASRSQPMRFGPTAHVALNYTCSGDAMTVTVPAQGPMPSFSVDLERVRE